MTAAVAGAGAATFAVTGAAGMAGAAGVAENAKLEPKTLAAIQRVFKEFFMVNSGKLIEWISTCFVDSSSTDMNCTNSNLV